MLPDNSGCFRRRRKAAILFIASILTCAPLLPDRDRPADYTGSGMKKVLSAVRSFLQGWNDSRASLDERPGMESRFTYDYWIDSTEVTQGRYYEVTGKRPVGPGSAYGFGDDYPVYRVSWFDAVLFCNARSRLEGLDTVYVYSGVKALSNGTVYELTGLWYDLRRDGYRLPTESEWEYAARGGSSALPYSLSADSAYASYDAWYGENSSGRTHPVGSRLPNSLGLYDMAGNVFEWTNDWKCQYTGESITNSTGAMEPGREYEKIVKGGSCNYSLMYLRPSRRSATYATMLASANECVGFRCARGVVPNGQYIGMETSFRPNPVTITASGSGLRSFVRMSECKLVFVNVTGTNRTLCYVDFGCAYPQVHEYTDDLDVYHPSLSPDGRYVAYCSRMEGQSGPSKVSIRSLDSLNTPIVQLRSDTAYIPRWWINPQSGYTCIVYTNSAVDNENLLWNATKTFIRRMSGGLPVGVPEELISNGSYHDGISLNGRYAVTGYRQLKRRDVISGVDTQLFVSPENGKEAGGSVQVCNVSISPDTGDDVRSMFLDFGYPGVSTVTGSSYREHEYLFVCDMEGRVTDCMRCPGGENTWDGVEWTNQPRFGVGCGRDGSYKAHAVYVIDLAGKSYRQLVTGTELNQPYLFVEHAISTELDSLGRYNEPYVSNDQACLATKLLMFWRLFDSLEIAVLGSSVAMDGIDPKRFTGGYTSYNLAAFYEDLLGQKIIIERYLLPHASEIKVICSSLDIYWMGVRDGNLSWRQNVGQSKGYLYDSCHGFWPGIISSVFKEIIYTVPIPLPQYTDTNTMGYVGPPSLGWGPDPPTCNYFDDWKITDPACQQNLANIHTLADTLRSRGIHWIMINLPLNPRYKVTECYFFCGPSRQTAHDVIQNLRDLADTNAFFHFYDANNDGDNDYEYLDFFDRMHLSGRGAAKLSVRIDSIIHAALQ